jgi:hypothetical protein
MRAATTLSKLSLSLLLLLLATVTRVPAQDSEPSAEPPRVEPKAADSDAPLPLGFPDATKPGEIEVKDYPAYRSAVAKSDGAMAQGGDLLFFWLFNHIQKKDIAMTAPVINNYQDAEMLQNPSARGNLSMEFLYRQPDQGETGEGVGPVEVKDFPPAKYVCLGIQGRMTNPVMREGIETLNAWLEASKEWEPAGPPRRLGYHGPMTPVEQRLWEIQIPVKPTSNEESDQ